MVAEHAQNQQETPNFKKPLTGHHPTPKKWDWSRLLFWRGQTKQDTLQPEVTTNEGSGSELSGIIVSAHKCPFVVFEDCIVDNNYKGLGEASDEVLQNAWLTLYSEYCTLIGDGASNARIVQVAKATAMSAKIDRVKSLIRNAIETGAETFLQCLRDSGYKVEILADLNKIIASIKTEEIRLGMLMKNLNKDDKGSKITRDYFDDMLAAFADKDNLGVSVNKSDPNFMLSSYCALYRRMGKKQENVERINNKRKK